MKGNDDDMVSLVKSIVSRGGGDKDEIGEETGGGWVVERESGGKREGWLGEGDRAVTEFCLLVVIVLDGVSGACEEGTREEVGLGSTFLDSGLSFSMPGLSTLIPAISPSGSKSSANFLRIGRLSFESVAMAVRSSSRRKAMRGSFSSKP